LVVEEESEGEEGMDGRLVESENQQMVEKE
jgi:hypothetical protein